MLLLSISGSLLAQTFVSGLISSDTDWNIDGSPYIVEGNILLLSGIKLTIDPGVTIKFDSGKTMQVDGELIAIGDSLNQIIITSNEPDSIPGYWNHIHFTQSSSNAVFDEEWNYLSGSILKYCKLLHGGGLDNGILFIDNSAPFISNCTIGSSSSSGIYFKKGYSRIENCKIINNLGSGFHCNDRGVYNDITIDNNIISNNYGSGIRFDDVWFKNIYLLNNTVSYNLDGGIFVYSAGGSGNANFIIEGNKIFSNFSAQGSAISFDGGFDIDISCNAIYENETSYGSVIFLDGGFDNYVITISNNNIIENISTTGDIIDLLFYTTYTTTISLLDNNISDNVASSEGAIINIKGNLSVERYSIINNTLKQNSGLTTLKLYKFNGHINSNNIYNNTAYEIINENTAGALTIDAKNNYWNTDDINEIGEKIFDWFDDATLSLVEIDPLLSDSIISDYDCSPGIITSIFSAGESDYFSRDFLKIYPNPFSDYFHLIHAHPEDNMNYSFVIYSLDGREIKRVDNIHKEIVSLNTRGMKKGAYVFVVIRNNQIIQKGKLIAQ